MLHPHWFVPLLILSCSLAAAQPTLWFSKSDLPRLKTVITAEPEAAVWAELLAQANGYCTPGTPIYLAPEEIAARPKVEGRVQVLGHHFGRRLTNSMETLGFAYQMTGDERFARHGVMILEEAARKLKVSEPDIAKGFAGARGDIMRGLAVGYDWLGETMTPAQKALWAETAAEYVRNMVSEVQRETVWWRPHHNFMGVAMGAAGLLALQLQEAYPQEAPGWLATCTEMIGKWLEEGFDEQGAYVEGTLYGVYGLSNALRFADALKRSGGPDLFQTPRLRRVPRFYALSLLPGERVFDARNDANYAGLGDPIMLRLAAAFNDPVAKWLWNTAGAGSAPHRIIWHNEVAAVAPTGPLAEHFIGRGLCIWRTGWETRDVMFSVEAGPFYPITHNQGDKGHFTLYGLGQRWAIDSGYGNNRLPDGRDSTLAHNCILIDGEGQAPSGCGAGTNGKIVTYSDDPSYGYALADATEAYNRNNSGQPGAVVEHALRHTWFVRPSTGLPAYALIADDLVKDAAPREYTWLLHIPAGMTVEMLDDGALLKSEAAYARTFVHTPSEATGRGEASWTFEAPEAAEYALWAQVRAGGQELGKSDSFLVQVDEGEVIHWHMPTSGTWTWGKISSGVPAEPVTFRLSAGRHRLKILTREAGAELERLLLTRDLAAGPPAAPNALGVALAAEQATLTAPMERVTVAADPQAPRLRLWLSASGPLRYELVRYDDHQLLKAHVTAVKPDFAACLVPLPAGVAEPQVRITRETALRVEVAWPGRSDQLEWTTSGNVPPVLTLKTR